MKYAFLILSLVMVVSGCVYDPPKPLDQASKDELAASLIARHDFIGIFEHHAELVEVTRGHQTLLSKPVEKFILDCCVNKADAIKLLEENGFEVRPMKREGSLKAYTEAWHARRLARPVNLLTATQYHVSVFVVGEKVKKVTASYFTDFNPADFPLKNYKPHAINR